jgi:hypothetical protein
MPVLVCTDRPSQASTCLEPSSGIPASPRTSGSTRALRIQTWPGLLGDGPSEVHPVDEVIRVVRVGVMAPASSSAFNDSQTTGNENGHNRGDGESKRQGYDGALGSRHLQVVEFRAVAPDVLGYCRVLELLGVRLRQRA